MPFVKLVGTPNRHTVWTSEIIIGDKTVSVGSPADLNQSDIDALEKKGYEFESSSKKEAETSGQSAVGDTAGASPVFGGSGGSNQSEDDSGSKK